MSNQVLSIEQCKELVSMGIDMSNASAMWIADLDLEYNPVSWKVFFRNDDKTIEYWQEKFPLTYKGGNTYYTFTLQDILEILPSEWTFVKDYCEESDRDPQTYFLFIETGALQDKHGVRCDTMLECAFNMLKWCKENKYI